MWKGIQSSYERVCAGVARMVGGESRKSRRPFAVTNSKPLSKSSRAPGRARSETSSENTSLKGLTSSIARNISNNEASPDTRELCVGPTTITSSENTGEVIVENNSKTEVWPRPPQRPPQLPPKTPMCRDRRTLRVDRRGLGHEIGCSPVCDQL